MHIFDSMKVLPFQIPKPTKGNLIYQEDHAYIFYDKLHQHEEVQLSYIVQGSGTLIVGDTISTYKTGDVLAIGSNLPHLFKSEVNTIEKSLMLTLFFSKESFGSHFFDLEELKVTKAFFNHVENGFRLLSHKKGLENEFISLQTMSSLERFASFLKILQLMSKAKKESLSSYVYKKNYSVNEGKRMRDIMDYTMNNFHEKITLDRISDIASMTRNAFCKYFKKRTNKTYIEFLHEVRIENAVKLLQGKPEVSISEVAFQSGYENISNFNRQFKKIKNQTPSGYLKMS